VVTGWTLVVMAAVAFTNAWMAVIGVRVENLDEKRLWESDTGLYIPPHFLYPGFYRGLQINIGFAGASLAIATLFLPNNSIFLSKEAVGVFVFLNLGVGLLAACIVSSAFDRPLQCCEARFWRVVTCSAIALVVYIATGILLCYYHGRLS